MCFQVQGTPWGRSPLRTAESRVTCDDWAFPAGQAVTMIAFNYPSAGGPGASPMGAGEHFQQHHCWFPITELDMPNPTTGEWGDLWGVRV